MKFCNRCKNFKEHEDFSKNNKSRDKLDYYCKKCKNEYSKLYMKDPKNKHLKYEKIKRNRRNNPDLYKKIQRKYDLKKKFNITLEQYNEILKKQNNCCDICKKSNLNEIKDLSVDHCHKTNKIRGLLCQNCNTALGLLKEDRQIFENGIKYINKWSSGKDMDFYKQYMKENKNGDVL